jgi:hypothetical protein
MAAQQANLLAPPNERRQALNNADVKSSLNLALTENTPKSGAAGDPLQVLAPEIPISKSSAGKSASRLRDDQAAR